MALEKRIGVIISRPICDAWDDFNAILPSLRLLDFECLNINLLLKW